MIIGLKLYRNNIFCLELNAIFKVEKMNFGSKFGAWVSFHTAMLQSRKIQENLGPTVVVLPLVSCITEP